MIEIIVFLILGAAALLALYKLVTFKEASKKVLVLDVLTTLITGVLVLLSLVFDSSFLLDIALVYAILSFAAVLVVARYLEGGL
ncbi:MAG: cation:proton antiporter [Spirochaeta sp.]|nr:cation:proton antiporter [Spirochaeta sp.]